MLKIKDYTGSVYGGLGHLLHNYCQMNNLTISPVLQNIQDIERFDFKIWRDLLCEIDQSARKPALGLNIAKYVKPQHLGVIAYIVLSCDTLSEALNRYRDFHRLIYDGSPLKIENFDGNLAIRWEEISLNLTTQVTDEIAIALFVQFLRLYLSLDNLQINEVHFRHPAPKHVAIYERFFQCTVKFSQPSVQIILPIHFLNTPLKQPDQTLQQLLIQQAHDLLRKLPNSTQLDERLQQAILIGLQKNNFQIENVANQLKISVRQLQRHLQQQQTTFQQRVQHVRQLLATQYLQDPYLSLQEIALLLSYSEQSAFHRAFKQWMGLTPQQWRMTHLNQNLRS